jgi:hypothetical protein
MESIIRLVIGPYAIDLTDIDAHFVLSGSLDLSVAGQIRMLLLVKGSDAAAMRANWTRLEAALALIPRSGAAEGDAWPRLELGLAGAAPVAFALTSGSATPQRLLSGGAKQETLLTLACLPYALGVPTPLVAEPVVLSNDDPSVVIAVPDCRDALLRLTATDVSSSGAVNRMQWAVRHGPEGSLGDWTPWVDAVAQAGATLAAGVVSRTTSSLTPVGLARAVQPNSALYQGPMDVYALVGATATALAAPTDLVVTPTLPTGQVSHRYTPTATPNVRVAQHRGTGATITASFGSPVAAGATLIAIASISSSAGIPSQSLANFELITALQPIPGSEWRVIMWRRENIPAGISGVSYTHGATVSFPNACVLTVVAVEGVAPAAIVQLQPQSVNNSTWTLDTQTRHANELSLVIGVRGTGDAGDHASLWSGGYTEALDANNAIVGFRIHPADGETPKATLVEAAPTTWYGLMTVLLPAGTASEVTLYDEPLPGALPPGSYTVSVQGRDRANRRGPALSHAPVALTADVDGHRLDLSWTPPAGGVASTLITIDAGALGIYQDEVEGTATSYRLASLEAVARLPAATLSAEPAPGPLVMLRSGTASGVLTAPPGARIVELDPDGALRAMCLARHAELPPAPELADGTRPPWALEVDIASGNGLPASVALHDLWLAPADAAQPIVQAADLNVAVPRRWVLEAHHSGRGITAHIRSTGAGYPPAEDARGSGQLLVGSGAVALSVLLVSAGGVVTGNEAISVTGEIVPRYAWQQVQEALDG